jgi:hypothetical protein
LSHDLFQLTEVIQLVRNRATLLWMLFCFTGVCDEEDGEGLIHFYSQDTKEQRGITKYVGFGKC